MPDSRRAETAALLFVLLFPGAFTWVYFVLLAHSATWLQQSFYVGGKTIQFAFPAIWFLLVQRRRLAWKRPSTAGLLEGLLFGAVVLAAMVAIHHAWLKPAGYLAFAAAPIRRRVTRFGVDSLPEYVLLGAFYSLVHSLLEEYYWRWFVFGKLRELVAWKTAVAISSAAFMLHHVIVLGTFFGLASPATWLFSLAVALGGAFWAWLYHRSGSLYGPWLSHLLIDVAIFVVGYDLVGPLG